MGEWGGQGAPSFSAEGRSRWGVLASLLSPTTHPLALLPWRLLWLAQQVGGVPEARLPRRSFRMPPSHNPLFLGTPASCLLLSLRLDATEGESAIGRAFTSPSLSPGDAMLVLWRAAGPQLPTAINLALQCCRKVQKKYGTYDTHSGLKLHLKIGTGTDGSAVPHAQPQYPPEPMDSLPCQHLQGKQEAARAGEAGAPSLPASRQL